MADEWVKVDAQPSGSLWEQPMREPSDPDAWWPVRLGKSVYESGKAAVKLPYQVYTGERPIESLTPADTLNFAAWGLGPNPGIRAGDRMIPGIGLARKEGAPSELALKRASERNFADFRKSGILMGGEAVGEFGNRVLKELNDEGFLQLDAPSTYESLTRLANPPPNAALSATAFHTARKRLARVSRKTTEGRPTEDAAAATLALKRLDEFFSGLSQEGFVVGSPAEVAAARAAFGKGKGNYAAAKRSESVSRVEDTAELRAAAANSGANLDNALRSRFATILADPKKRRGYSPAELDQMRVIVEGGNVQNALRIGSNLLGGGGGLGALATGMPGAIAGGMTGNPYLMAMAGLPVVGAAMKAGENALASRNVAKLGEMTRARSPQSAEGGAYQGGLVSAEKRAALLKLLPSIFKHDPEAALKLYQQLNPNSL